MSTATTDALLAEVDALDKDPNPGWRGEAARNERARTLLPMLATLLREHREESARAREMIGAMRLEIDRLRDSLCDVLREAPVPDEGRCEYTWSPGEFCGAPAMPGTFRCKGHAREITATCPDHEAYQRIRAAARLLAECAKVTR